jgi:hypothetical protein
MDNPPANPDVLKIQLETQKAKDANENKLHELEQAAMTQLDQRMKLEAEIDLIKAQTMKTLAEAAAVEPGQQLEQYRAFADDMAKVRQHERELKKLGIDAEEGGSNEPAGEDTQGASSGMAPEPPNTESNAMPQGGAPSTPGLPPERTNLDAVLSGSDGNADYAAIGENLRNESNSGNIG